MPNDIRLHGYLDNKIEYYAITAGGDAHQRYFFNIDQNQEGEIRFFSPGNEFIIGRTGVSHRGNGGSFCEYMFGVDQPLVDQAKGDVINRLVIYGTHYDLKSGSLKFADRTDSALTYEKIFFDGNAIANYFFFVHAEGLNRTVRKQQEELLRTLGKSLKRSTAVALV